VGYLRIIIPSCRFCWSAWWAARSCARTGRAAGDDGDDLGRAGECRARPDPDLRSDLELTGAALASVAALDHRGCRASADPAELRGAGAARPAGSPRTFRPVFALALPAILTQLATPVGQAFVTRAMAEFGEAAVAGMAIVARLTPVAFGVIFALSGAVGPIIGQNAGAGEGARVRRAYRDALIFTAIVVLPISLILFLLRGPIVALFDARA
jgi:hypothetical protein